MSNHKNKLVLKICLKLYDQNFEFFRPSVCIKKHNLAAVCTIQFLRMYAREWEQWLAELVLEEKQKSIFETLTSYFCCPTPNLTLYKTIKALTKSN